jgi:alpha-D-xyloside xylohydrolase
MRNASFCCLAALLLASCSGQDYVKTSDGVTVLLKQNQPTDVRQVRLQVMGEKLIHVSATPDKKFADRPSLSVLPQATATPFQVETTDSTVSVVTSALRATVFRTTGEVRFADLDGHVILAENKGGGKTFVPHECEGKKEYSVRQVFESADDEAFYGLGQHQADEFNYKGKNEELFQYNTKVSVPFIVSNKNYGLLWDSYSLSRFGNPTDYLQLGEVFKLYDKDGKEGALTGTYTPSPKSGSETLVRRENSLYFEHLDRADHLNSVVNLPSGFPFKDSHVTYEGQIEPSETGTFPFILYYAGYMKVYVNDELVVPERWRTAWNPNSYKFTVRLEAGQRVPLRIEWNPDGYVSYCGLRALHPAAPEEAGKQSWWSEMNPDIDYYFVAGDNMDEVISGYRTLTGKSQVMPKWAMGYWQSRERYKTQDEIVSTLAEFRKRQIPIDNIVQDWSYWPEDAWGSHDFDKDRFPDPKAMVDSIHSLHGRVMISVWPKFYATTDNYKAFDEKGWMYQQAIQDSIKDWIGPGYLGSFYDAYSADARKLFWQQMQDKLYPLGFDAWWMDASEPNIRDCTDLQYRKDLCGPTALGPSDEYFNAYALMNAEAIYDGQRGVDPDKRVFLLTRSGFSGLQRYSTATWSGDIATRWEDLKAQISAGLNFAISGIPYWTMDIGGFCVEDRYVAGQDEFNKTGRENADNKEWRELNTRWFQFGAFCPLYRAHGQYPLREPWNIAPETHPAYKSILYYTKLRYRLMPYIYSLAGMTYLNDYTIMRPLVMDFTADANVRDISDQYMFGPALMVCPVYTYGARQRQVYFPAGSVWYDYYTGARIEGGQTLTVDAPYEHIPLFVRAGSILPNGPEMQYSDEKQPEVIDLYLYPGQDGQFSLYEDEGVNYNYEKGQYALIHFTYHDAEGLLEISPRKGEFPGMLKKRTFRIIQGNKQPVEVQYDGVAQMVNL